MDDAIRNAAVFGALALACGSFGWWPRYGGLASASLALAALVVAVVLGVIDPLAPALWASAWPGYPLLLLAAWGLLALGVRRLGGVGGVGPTLLGAFLGGAAFGALPVAVGLAPGQPPARAARLCLAATAGGLCGPLGSAPMLLLSGPDALALLWPLGLVMGLLAALPWSDRGLGLLPRGPTAWILLAVSLPLWLLAVFGSPELALVAGLVVVWGLVAWRKPGGLVPGSPASLRLGAVLVCVLLLVPAGVFDFLAWGLDDARVMLGGLLEAGFGLAGLGVAVLVGGPPVALAGALSACSDPSAFVPSLRAALVAGAAVGSLVPVMVLAGIGVLRAGLGRWALALLLLLGWLALHSA